MTKLPNPFDSGACHVPPTPDEAAASFPRMPSVDAAAEIPSSIQRLLAEIENEYRFVLDEEKFLADIEPPPLFLQRTG